LKVIGTMLQVLWFLIIFIWSLWYIFESYWTCREHLAIVRGLWTFPKDPKVKVERRVQKHLSKHKNALPIDMKHKVTPYRSDPLHLRGASRKFPK
jgi:hypothetical protein